MMPIVLDYGPQLTQFLHLSMWTYSTHRHISSCFPHEPEG